MNHTLGFVIQDFYEKSCPVRKVCSGMESLADVVSLIARANAVRCSRAGVSGAEASASAEAEEKLETLFRTSQTLAVYGTLAPGKPNHHVIAPLGGEWTPGTIEGDLAPLGWGAAQGYPAFWPRPGGASVTVQVVSTPELATAWEMLDEFEGPAYCRILVPVFTPGRHEERQLLTVANLYAIEPPGS